MTIWLPELPSPSDGPVYRAIARALEADIRGGRLAAGERLPTHRHLADHLGVNVGTVSRAYAECERAGWIRGEVGRGTFVRGVEMPVAEGRFGRPPAAGRASPEGLIDLGLNYPVASPAPDLPAALRALAAEVEASGASGDPVDLLGYRGPEGDERDREAGAALLALHGIAAPAARVVLAAGAQHGLSAALAATCPPGEAVAAEGLCYPGLVAAAEARGLRVVPVAMDGEGVLPESFQEVCENVRPRAFYLSPTVQNPTTSTLSQARREQVAAIAERHEVWLVEDDVHRLLAPEAPPPLAAIAPERTIHVASVSKCLAPALRIAYLAVPVALRERVIDQVWASVWTASPITAALASGWLRDGTLERVVAGRRAEAASRQRLAADVLGHLPPGFRVHGGGSAYHVWLELPDPWNASAFANAVRDQGVIVTPSDAFHLGPGPAPPAVRLSLSCAPDRAVLDGALRAVVRAAERPETGRVRV